MRVAIAEQVFAERVDDETVLLELEAGSYYGLDPVAARLWDLLGELGSIEAVAEVASGEYDVSLEQLTEDLNALVAELAERNLIVMEGHAAPSRR
ncbi:MAG TPA: PqqD family protein [Polyangiaceae bacterium]|nr:PqqD family protein [Polyangiaceae bacterium]